MDTRDIAVLECLKAHGKLNMSQLIELTGFPSQTLHNHVNRLIASGYLKSERKGFPRTRHVELTSKGEEVLATLIEAESENVKENVKGEVEHKLRLFGSALLLQPQRGVFAGATGILIARDLTRAFIAPGSVEKEWLGFLADLYIASPVKLFGRPPKNFVELRACWQLVRSEAWFERDEREGFLFDFPSAWEKLFPPLSRQLKAKIEERKLNRRRAFRELRVFSFPVVERISLAKKGVDLAAPPPAEAEAKLL